MGDEEEDDTDDLESEFDIGGNLRRDHPHMSESMFSTRLNYGSVNGSVHTPSEFDAASVASEIPLLTYGQEVSSFSSLVSLFFFSEFYYTILLFDPICHNNCFSIKDVGISADKHALILPPFMARGKRIYPMPFPDSSVPGK